MEKNIFTDISQNLKNYEHSSMEYIEYDEISEYSILFNNEQLVLLLGFNSESKMNEFHWAANEVSALLDGVNQSKDKAIITFIPKEWVEELEKNGFRIYAIWNDYFNNEISANIEQVNQFEVLKEAECKEASDVTTSCQGQSRGFSGQTVDWFKQWLNGTEPNLVASSGKDSTVLIHRDGNRIAGVICLNVYGHNNEKGAIVWVREIAVHPEFQRRGIAKTLFKQGLAYGSAHGAKRGFLMADECNENAIKLYEEMGFVANKNEAQIDMLRE